MNKLKDKIVKAQYLRQLYEAALERGYGPIDDVVKGIPPAKLLGKVIGFSIIVIDVRTSMIATYFYGEQIEGTDKNRLLCWSKKSLNSDEEDQSLLRKDLQLQIALFEVETNVTMHNVPSMFSLPGLLDRAWRTELLGML